MSSDIARGVIAELRAENKKLKREVEIFEWLMDPARYLRAIAAGLQQKKQDEQRNTPHRRRRK